MSAVEVKEIISVYWFVELTETGRTEAVLNLINYAAFNEGSIS